MTPPDAAWRRTNLGHLLFAATGRCIALKLRVVHAAGFAGVTDAQLTLFQTIGQEGTRLTALAANAGLAKQSMIELVNRAERQGWVERTPDPDDRRAKVVALTPTGVALRTAACRGLTNAERAFAAAVGPRNLPAIRGALSVFAPETAAAPPIETALAHAGRRFVRDVLGAVHRHGYHDVTEALLALFRTLEPGGSRLTEVAAAARVTKQSMRSLVERAEAMKLVERAPDPLDGRARIIMFSRAGWTMLEEMRGGVMAAEAGFAGITGEALLHDLKRWLETFLSTAPAI